MLAMLTMRPQRCLIICLSASLVQRKAPLRLMFITWSQSSSDMRIINLSRVIPALLTSMSTFEKASIAFSTSLVTSSATLMSAGMKIDFLPFDSTSATTSGAPVEPSMSLTMISAPRSANLSAIALPMPRPLPVTNATLLVRCMNIPVQTLYIIYMQNLDVLVYASDQSRKNPARANFDESGDP